MELPEYVTRPDEHLKPAVARTYDDGSADRFSAEAIAPVVDLLVGLADGGPVVEFAIGTGRIGVPLVDRVETLYGIDFSEPMLAELAKKPGADRIAVTHGDITTTNVCSDASLVYLVFNTITNLKTQALQTECFRNAANHLAPGGRFVIENYVPILRHLPAGGTTKVFHKTDTYVGVDEYVDFARQISISHHYHIDGENSRLVSGSFRYVWPSELDLMAQLAGLELEHRWADWHKAPFDGDSPAHLSVWRKP